VIKYRKTKGKTNIKYNICVLQNIDTFRIFRSNLFTLDRMIFLGYVYRGYDPCSCMEINIVFAVTYLSIL